MSKSKKKASEIFKTSEPFLSKKIKIAEAFPQISNVTIDVREYEDYMEKDDGYFPIHQVFDESDISQYIDCSENNCKGGGFSIGSILSEMVRKEQLSLEDSASCIGKIGSKRCSHTFKYTISITFK